MVFFSKKDARRVRRVETEVSTLRHVFYGVLTIIIVVILGGVIWYATRLQVFTIQSIEIVGGQTIGHDSIKSLVEEELRGNYILLIPYRFTYLYPSEQILQKITSIPRIKNATIDRDKTTLTVTFTEYVPYALWCLSREDNAPCYFLDEEGYAFASAPPLRGGALVRHIFEAETELEERQILDKDTLIMMYLFMESLENGARMHVSEVTHTEGGDILYHVSGGGDIVTAHDVSVKETYDNLKSILDSEEFKHIAPGNFRYIDLRFGNKVYVNENLFETATTSATSTVTGHATSTEDLPSL